MNQKITLYDALSFNTSLQNTATPSITLFRSTILSASAKLAEAFTQGVEASVLVRLRSNFIDTLLHQAWDKYIATPSSPMSLIAVGGYGRGELHPYSDIDILILSKNKLSSEEEETLSQYITFLWDIGLDIGQSVRTLDECKKSALGDITVITNLIESRLITGSRELFRTMIKLTSKDNIWTSKRFFLKKLEEQQKRHARFHDTAYNLEPNIKENPGGLRDIQMIRWVTRRHFGDHGLQELVQREFLTTHEYKTLKEGERFLWKIRFALHVLTKRKEDRLLFDFQQTLAKQLNFNDEKPAKNILKNALNRAADGHRLGVELFMKRYFRTVMELGRLNEMLLQHFQEAILYTDDHQKPININRRFQVRKGYLEVTTDRVFKTYPFALLEAFLLLQSNPHIKGVRASTIRLIRDHRYLIDDKFREDIRCRTIFIEILKQERGVTQALRRMNSYGILAAYIPAFAKIVGQMQYDLFHVYTVDQHTLFVIRNLRRFSVEKFAEEFPLCSKITNTIPKTELLYLAGLFHDIAKGRGGDHSILGAKDAQIFLQKHDLSKDDIELVSWLVEKHLFMSSVAQQKDIDDPEVINQFAFDVGNRIKLDYLYLLTVADMRATNPKLWTSWKASLLIKLYKQTKKAFIRGLENPFNEKELIHESKIAARKILVQRGNTLSDIEKLWTKMDGTYFIRYNANEIARHTEALLNFDYSKNESLILLYHNIERGGTDIFLHTSIQGHSFSGMTSTLDRLGLIIFEAIITPSLNNYTLDTYSVLEFDGKPVTEPERLQKIESVLREQIRSKKAPVLIKKCGAERKIEHFSRLTQVNMVSDENNDRTILEVISTDRQGLLSRIAYAMRLCELNLQAAKISTYGAQAEDFFFVTGKDGKAIVDPEKRAQIRATICEYVDSSRI